MSRIHFEPLRSNRFFGVPDRYEFTHGTCSVCVYDIKTLNFIEEIPVGTKPDCHATSPDNRYLYIACLEGLYCIDQQSLKVVKVLNTGRVYATNVLPDGKTLLVHDLAGGIVVIDDMMDMDKIHIRCRLPVIPNGEFRCEIGGKGNFLVGDRYYLCAGWHQKKLYQFDTRNNFSFVDFMEANPILDGSDDLVLNHDRTKAYTACHKGWEKRGYVAVIDIASHTITKTIPTGIGTCGLTMTNDERYVIASNDQEDSISVIDTEIDEIVNTPCAREGFDALGITGYIQGISCGVNDEIYVYGCKGNGAIVRFTDVVKSNRFEISWSSGKYKNF